MALIAVSPEELEQRVRERADMVESQFVTSAEIFRFLEAAWQEFYGIMVAAGEDLFIRKATILASAVDALGTEDHDTIVTENGDVIIIGPAADIAHYVDLPPQFKALRLIRHTDGERLRKVTLHDLESFSTATGRPRFYRLAMDPINTYLRMELLPHPDVSYSLDLYYVPAISLREFLLTSYVSIPVRGWDEYLVLTAAAKAKDKEESDAMLLLKEREVLLERIRADLVPVDKSEPDVVVQMSSMGRGSDMELLFGDDEVFS
jgi:hypothetical protein